MIPSHVRSRFERYWREGCLGPEARTKHCLGGHAANESRMEGAAGEAERYVAYNDSQGDEFPQDPKHFRLTSQALQSCKKHKWQAAKTLVEGTIGGGPDDPDLEVLEQRDGGDVRICQVRKSSEVPVVLSAYYVADQDAWTYSSFELYRPEQRQLAEFKGIHLIKNPGESTEGNLNLVRWQETELVDRGIRVP